MGSSAVPTIGLLLAALVSVAACDSGSVEHDDRANAASEAAVQEASQEEDVPQDCKEWATLMATLSCSIANMQAIDSARFSADLQDAKAREAKFRTLGEKLCRNSTMAATYGRAAESEAAFELAGQFESGVSRAYIINGCYSAIAPKINSTAASDPGGNVFGSKSVNTSPARVETQSPKLTGPAVPVITLDGNIPSWVSSRDGRQKCTSEQELQLSGVVLITSDRPAALKLAKPVCFTVFRGTEITSDLVQLDLTAGERSELRHGMTASFTGYIEDSKVALSRAEPMVSPLTLQNADQHD